MVKDLLEPNAPFEPWIVCAAVQFEDGLIVAGARHFDPVMRSVIGRLGLTGSFGPKQGFIDQRGNFLTRQEAMVIARKNGQLLDHVGPSNTLFSESIY